MPTPPAPAPTLAQALEQARTQGLQRIDAQMLLLHALGDADADRAWLLAHDGDALAPAAQARFQALCRRRAAGEPLAYLTGSKEFYGLRLAVDARVLDPRADTETLVDWALALSADWPAPRIVDLGTGSGAIALALRHERPDAQLLAVDASAAALAVAQANALRLGLRVQFAQSHWLSAVAGRFELIVANPPYLRAQDPHLIALAHEPRQALVGGVDGLQELRSIVAQAGGHLAPGGWLLLEHGYDQADAVRALLAAQGFARVQSRKDLAGIERCSGGQWPGNGPAMAR